MTHKYRTWCEVDLDAIKHNLRQYIDHAGDNVKILAVIKADAYGHGAVECAKNLEKFGVDYFAVAFVDEAITLRKEGIKTPILILGYTPNNVAEEMVKYDITATVFNYENAKAFSEQAVSQKKTAKIHIKIDTGMSRIGFSGKPADIANEVLKISKLPGLDLEGIFTHFAKADELDKTATLAQFDKFCDVINVCEEANITFRIKHCCNSAAAMLYPQMHLDMIRIGIAMYGCYPSDIEYNLDLIPAMSFKTRVVNVKNINPGDSVSYGGTYTANKTVKIATIAAGYADGYSRLLSGKSRVVINNHFSKITGKICMDQCMIDVTNVNNVNVGDEVVLFGTKGSISLPVEELAKIVGTISYEILCGIGARVPRIYLNHTTV